MGWKGTMRSLAAASRRAERETNRQRRAIARDSSRQFKELERSVEKFCRSLERLEAKLESDPIAALDIRYSEDGGFISEPLEVKTPVFSGSLQLLDDHDDDSSLPSTSQSGGFLPPSHVVRGAEVRPIELFIFRQYAIIIALQVSCTDPAYRIRLNWVKQRNPSSSQVFLVDPDTAEYYFPKSTDLKGDVVPGCPRTGCIAFEPIRRPTRRLELHFSDVKLTSHRGERHQFVLQYESERLEVDTAAALRKPTIATEMRLQLHQLVQERVRSIENQTEAALRKATGCGCAVVAIAVTALMAALVAMAI